MSMIRYMVLFFVAVISFATSGGWLAGAAGLRLTPGGQYVTLEKVQVIDCRAVRGFLGCPVDGTLASWDYLGKIYEYPGYGGILYDTMAGVGYNFNNNDGLHITLADPSGFDMAVLRGERRPEST